MGVQNHWPRVVRIAWSTGGVVAVNEPGPDVTVMAGFGGPEIQKLRIVGFDALFAALYNEGLPTLGATFAQTPEEFQGIRPPEFRAMSVTCDSWLVREAQQKWRQIAFGAWRAGKMDLLDISSRIASGLLYSEMRLSDLVNAYSSQLRGRAPTGGSKTYERFKDLNAPWVYKCIHALFWELAVLRDSLAQFAAVFCFSRTEIKSMKGLLGHLVNSRLADPLADEILRASDQANSGWVARFTSYRNLFTHLAPMEQAAGSAFVVQDLRELRSGLKIPQMFYALPGNVEEIVSKRSKGTLFGTPQELTDAAARHPKRGSDPDALEYLHSSIDRFTKLSHSLILRSPIAPEPIKIGPNDLRGPVEVT
jgi:hypothetical protein